MNFAIVHLGPPRRLLARCYDWPALPRDGESIVLTLEGREVRLDVVDVCYHCLPGRFTSPQIEVLEVLVFIPSAEDEALLARAATMTSEEHKP